MEIFNRETLVEAIKSGQKFDYLFFWGHREKADGEIGPSCCSQWFAVGFTQGNDFYRSAEHFMMAEKARLFNDEKIRHEILKAETPNEAKSLGRKVKNFDAEVWNASCFDIVVEGNFQKFSQNPRLAHWLCATNPKILVEASPTDAIWGIGLHQDDPLSRNPLDWQGSNLLGFALMKVRNKLICERK
ncbi:MAG: NADAR family protein [Candidatus Obscuribacterales bacterium]|nr:NADAR family protein [Candidatus Obscuribacterales bacterium]